MTSLKNRTLLIGIGAQKAGTTWLHSYLSNHPDVFMTPFKELHVFNNRHYNDKNNYKNKLLTRAINILNNSIKTKGTISSDSYKTVLKCVEKVLMVENLDSYMTHFSSLIKNERIYGEITPGYSVLPKEGFNEILSLDKNTKFIFIMRDPIRRAWSHINDEYARKSINAEYNSKLDKIFSSQENKYFCRSNYQLTIETLESVVDKTNILYLFYESLFHQKSICDLCQFLDIDWIDPDFSNQVNKSPYSPMGQIDIDIKSTIYSTIYEFCKDRFPKDLPESWGRF